MKRFVFVMALLIAIGGGVYYGGTHSFVKTSDGIKIYEKSAFTLTDTYVDMTSMSVIGLRNHVDLVGVMAREGDLEYLPGGNTLIELSRAGENILDAVSKFDNEYQISNSVNEIERIGREKYKSLDQQYDITRKVQKANEGIKEASSRFNNWLKSK